MIDSKWHAKLADFGDSKIIDEQQVESELIEFQLKQTKISQEEEDPDNMEGFDEV